LRTIGTQRGHLFIDEGGTFTPAAGWGVVCSLAIPHKSVGPARREIERITRSWPHKDGELKGGLLTTAHLVSLVDVLFRHDALMHTCAIDVAREEISEVERHKMLQGEGITKHLTPEHHPGVVKELRKLRHVVERMPNQLYIQCVLLSELVANASSEAINYFAQRRPRDLAYFEWTIDAKDPLRITTQEKWWRDTLAPLLESKSRREPMPYVNDPAFDYRFFEKCFGMEKDLWHPNKPREKIRGCDLKKMITEHIAYVDSRSEIFIQTVDILMSFLRRLLSKEIAGDDIANALGRLQIIKRRGGDPQSLQVITISREPKRRTGLFKTIKVMTSAGRNMMTAEKTLSRKRNNKKGA
jgi:hypothetical protein